MRPFITGLLCGIVAQVVAWISGTIAVSPIASVYRYEVTDYLSELSALANRSQLALDAGICILTFGIYFIVQLVNKLSSPAPHDTP